LPKNKKISRHPSGDWQLEIDQQNEKAKSGGWLGGVSRALPITLGYVPIGFAYGVLAQKAGLSAFNTLAMSIFVYAGSSQLIAVGLFAAGAAPLSIILTTFIVNLRHMLMASALAPYLSRWNKFEQGVFAYEITDESFALHSVAFPRVSPSVGPDPTESIALNFTAQISWVLGSWLGLVTGGLITDIEQFALDYTLPAMFIALLMMQLKNRVQLVVAVTSGVFAIVLLLAGLDHWYVITATVIGASLGVMVGEWTKKQS
jgi:4-azaleucine resistance transporter AzlC